LQISPITLDCPLPSALFSDGMASLGALVEIVADAEGVDSQRVAAFARSIREAGLITSRGRGPSAAEMSEADAANLLIAVNAAETARAAPDTVRRFRALRTNRKNQRAFGSVLEEMMAAAVKNELVDYLLDVDLGPIGIDRDKQRHALRTFHMRIEFQHKRPMAVIECRMPSIAMPKTMTFYPPNEGGVVPAKVDRRTITEITQNIILAVADIIRR
jgi:hypothetical protein